MEHSKKLHVGKKGGRARGHQSGEEEETATFNTKGNRTTSRTQRMKAKPEIRINLSLRQEKLKGKREPEPSTLFKKGERITKTDSPYDHSVPRDYVVLFPEARQLPENHKGKECSHRKKNQKTLRCESDKPK